MNTNKKGEISSRKVLKSIRRIDSFPVYIPENINIDALLNEYSVDIPNAKDYLLYLLHIIHAVPAFLKDKDIENDNGYTTLHSTILQKKVDRYADLLIWLEQRGIIEINRDYIPGKGSMGYRFTSSYRVELKKEYLTTWTLIKNILNRKISGNKKTYLKPENLYGYTLEGISTENITYSELAKRHLFYLDKWFNKDLKIDKDSCEKFLRFLLEQDKKNPEITQPLHKFNCRMMIVNEWAEQNFRFDVDDTAGRLHTLLVNLKSELRAFVKYKCETLIAADIKNSQPLLSIALIDYKLFVKNNMLNRIALYNENYIDTKPINRAYHLSTILEKFIKENSESSDILLYKQLILSGQLYEYFGNVLKQRGVAMGLADHSLRSFAKEHIFRAFFDSNQAMRYQDSHALRIFKELFPTVYEIFRMVKFKNHKTLACVLQNLEAEIVLHRTCKEISDINPEIPLFTIHDSIATKSEYIDFVKQKLTGHLYSAIEATPEIKLEVWDENFLKDKSNNAIPVKTANVNRYTKEVGYGYFFYEYCHSAKHVADQLKVGRNKLLSGLRTIGILDKDNKPTSEYIEKGYFEYRYSKMKNRYKRKNDSLVPSLKISDRGIVFIKNIIHNQPDLFPQS